jgi:pilus assembly protein Flp/PilA
MVKLFVTLQSFAMVTRDRIREEKGATAVEYGLMVGLIAVAIIVTVVLLGEQLDALFVKITGELEEPSGVAGGAAG